MSPWIYFDVSSSSYYGRKNDRKGSKFTCGLCGWQYSVYDDWSPVGYLDEVSDFKHYCINELKYFSINDADMALRELGTHIKNHYSDIYFLKPRRFEELVGDIYSTIGYEVILTKQTTDRGADLILLGGPRKESIIVECKRYSAKRAVGIGHIQRLIGVKISFNAKKAILVTSSYFSQPAIREAYHFRELKYETSLVDGYELAKMLRIYNDKLPPIDKIKPSFYLKRNLDIRVKKMFDMVKK